MTEYFYKLLSIALAVLLLGAGAAGWLAARDRDLARADLAAEQGITEQLRAGIREQNRAVDVLAKAKEAADARGQAAQQAAAAAGRRFDGALAKIAGARATTCAEAMPAVDLLLEAVR